MKEKIKKIFYPLLPLWKLWLKLGHILGTINTFILLTVFYLLILTPLGLLRKLFGKDDFKKMASQDNSFWTLRKPKDLTLSNYLRQF